MWHGADISFSTDCVTVIFLIVGAVAFDFLLLVTAMLAELSFVYVIALETLLSVI